MNADQLLEANDNAVFSDPVVDDYLECTGRRTNIIQAKFRFGLVFFHCKGLDIACFKSNNKV
jgi:hypothetical protein